MSELWSRLGFLAFALIIYRLGTHIPIPGINPEQVAALFQQSQGTILQYFNLFSGGALERMSIFALSVVPYISSAIVMQLFSNSLPYLQELKKDGQTGRNKITQYTRYGTVIFALVQSTALTVTLQSAGLIDAGSIFSAIVAILSIVTGTVFLMWLGEQITERGIGNGISLLIATSIIVGVPRAFGQALEQAQQGDLNYLLLIVLGILSIVIVAFVVFVENAQRKITVNYAQRNQVRGMIQAPSSFLPLKLNMSGVIPAIFASTFLLFPASLSSWFGSVDGLGGLQEFSLYLNPGQPLYILIFVILIVSFCYIWLALTFNSNDIADNLKRGGAFIPGIRPGEQTASFIDLILSRLTVFGAFYLSLVCILPLLLINSFGISFYLGGTSVLIVVVVLLDLQRQIQSYVMSEQYASILKNANISGSKKSRRR
ncbi:preprotein translocase subunit SecY [Bacteroidota bacterium]|jgi:preprotein translocase subunit SecY|nr:preprotein translocase subunit SecY [Gammaproteobacteria bacterium]MAO98817.1 preprotein translocase subunit SecY [Gammaproteobacteria bacterium]MDA9715856.1 preprotein translocase subunit SecY [Bacteroidota bacterium]|tara:strand:+ start:7811 stop:9097 length:1287 start_codon:yes stop_codon:yes gene_type:complete